MTAAESVQPLPVEPSIHFTWSEFACHDAIHTPYPLDWRVSRGVPLACELERIRDRIGPFTPASVYRTWAYHFAIYAAMSPRIPVPTGSGHLKGLAADVPCPQAMDWPAFVAAILASAGEGRAVTYIRFYQQQRFAHVEIRPTRKTLLVEYATT